MDDKPLNNIDFNIKLWNSYSKNWDKKKVFLENPNISESERDNYLKYLGDEWGTISDIPPIINEFIYPYITIDSITMEIGTGGGRIATKVVDKVKEFYCIDVSIEMLTRVKTVLNNYTNVNYVLIKEPESLTKLDVKFDFIFSFDVFVHLDLHMIWRYLKVIDKILKDDGVAFLHTTNLKAPDGWERFSKQKEYNPATHYFITPEMIDTLIKHTELEIIKSSNFDKNNLYLNRDYLFVLKKTL
ncbi:MAG: class I SAM-dependent methyltransferase [Cyanobacteriota bacterium]